MVQVPEQMCLYLEDQIISQGKIATMHRAEEKMRINIFYSIYLDLL